MFLSDYGRTTADYLQRGHVIPHQWRNRACFQNT
jgi:hypothetical protein